MYYHVTTAASARRIMQEGLKPRGLIRAKTIYGPGTPSMPTMVYLTTTQARANDIISELRWGETSELELALLVIAEDKLDEARLRPDEDYIRAMWSACSRPYHYRDGHEDFCGALDGDGVKIERLIANGNYTPARLIFEDGSVWPPVPTIDLWKMPIREMQRGLEKLSFLWPLSVDYHKTVAYKGIVQPSTIISCEAA